MNLGNSNPAMGRHRRAAGVFSNRQAAEQALSELRDSGFPMDRVSIVAKDADRRDEIAGAEVKDRVSNKADEGASIGALSGGTLGGLGGLLVGLGTLAIPGIGPIMLAGATATALATTVAGGAIGAVAGGLVGALIGLGIPEDRAKVYNDRVSRGDYLVMIDGSDEEIARAEQILRQRGIEEYGVYDAPNAASTHSNVQKGGVQKRAVGFFSNQRDAEDAINELRDGGFPLSQISMVAQNVERRGVFANLDIRNRLDNSRFGLPADRVDFLHNRVSQGDYMLVVEGTEDEVQRASTILNRRGVQEFSIYDAADVDRNRMDRTPVAQTNPEIVGDRISDPSRVSNEPRVDVVDRRDQDVR